MESSSKMNRSDLCIQLPFSVLTFADPAEEARVAGGQCWTAPNAALLFPGLRFPQGLGHPALHFPCLSQVVHAFLSSQSSFTVLSKYKI